MDDVETQLQSEDHGRDLTSVQSLLKKHQQLENDIASHQSEVDQAKEVAQSFAVAKHFMSEEITERVEAVTKRYYLPFKLYYYCIKVKVSPRSTFVLS